MYKRLNRFGALSGLAVAVALAGCTNLETSETWFTKPFNQASRSGGYTFTEMQETKQLRRITTNDLVDRSGACAPQQAPAGSPDTAAPGEGIALGMSECDVVFRAGQPSAVQLDRSPEGNRLATLTYTSGPRPGVYHFERGRLMEMDRVEEPPPPVAAKKPEKPKKPKKKNDQA